MLVFYFSLLRFTFLYQNNIIVYTTESTLTEP